MKIPPLFAPVEHDLKAVEAELVSVIRSPASLVSEIGEHLVRAGGKRLRPALCLICSRSGGNTPAKASVSLAVAVELIHMATLVHDDVIDVADKRRGVPTANQLWGNHVAVLSGDYLFARAFSTVAAHGSNEMLRILTEVICGMCEGEVSQIRSAFDPGQTEAGYFQRISQKTGQLIAAACRMGGLSAALEPVAVMGLNTYGHALGMAFQITDDILDVTASAGQIGKPAGNDLRQGIVTLPVIHALQFGAAGGELAGMLRSGAMTEEQVRRGLEIVAASGGADYAQTVADAYLDQAREALPPSVDPEVRKVLLAVADFVGQRKF